MDENIKRVLQLVQDEKITAQEAEGLIAALTGKSGSRGQGTGSGERLGGGGTATMAPPVAPESAYHETPETTSYARSQGLPTGEMLQQIADDPSIPENDKLTIIINSTSLLCAVLIIQPIPLADFFILTPIEVAGVLAMSQVMGQPLGKHGAGDMVTSIAAVMGGGLIAQQLMYAGVKTLVPLLGGIAIIPVVYAATYGLMHAARAILEAKRSNQNLSDEEIRRIRVEAEQRAKAEKRDWSPSALKRDLDAWRVKGEIFKQYETLFLEEQRRLRPLQEEAETLTAHVVSLSQQRMDLEQQLQTVTVHLSDSPSDAERQSLQAKHDGVRSELDRIQALWSSSATALESKRIDITQTTEKLEDTLRDRFGRNYPNISFVPGVITDLAQTPYTTLLAVERQISLLQYDPIKVNFQNDPFMDSEGQEIRSLAVNDETRLYTTTMGSTVLVRAIGTQSTASQDIARLKSA